MALSLVKAFPGATLYTSLYEPDLTFGEFGDVPIETSMLNGISLFRRHHRLALPLLAPCFSAMTVDADVVVCSSSGWAHAVRATGRKIVYCHTPARWLYDTARYVSTSPVARVAARSLRAPLVRWDREAAATAHRYISNSTVVRERIRRTYGIDAAVVPPPQTVDSSGQQRPVDGLGDSYYLCVSRLLSYKNVEQVLKAFSRLPEHRLAVVGSGPEERRLKALAPRNAVFLGTVLDPELRWLYSQARALVSASHEDFGLAPVEAAAFGVPAVVLRAGGFLDSVIEGRTGIFFDRADPDSIRDAVQRRERHAFEPQTLRAHAGSFSERAFQSRLRDIVDEEARRAG